MGKSSLQRRTIFGVVWSGVGQFGSQGIRMLVLLALAWLLSPTDFGLVGLAMLFVNFAHAFGELGLAAAIVQQKEIGEPDLSTAFWANLMAGLMLGGLTYAGAGSIADFLGDPEAKPLLQALAIVFPIIALAVVPRALLTKELQFQQITVRQFISQIAYGGTGLTLAAMGAGVWSLVGASIAEYLADALLLFTLIEWRPQPTFRFTALKNLLHFGLFVMLSALLTRAVLNIDYFVVGRWLGTEALGYYTLAYQLAVMPQRRLMGTLRSVAFPAFSLVQEDRSRLKAGFLQGTQHLFTILLPVGLLIAVLAPWLIEALYGPKWLPAVLPLQVLAVAGIFYGFDVAEPLYFAVGRPQVRMWLTGIRLGLFGMFATLFGVALGTTGVAASLTLAVLLTGVLGYIVASRPLKANIADLWRPLWPALRATMGAAIPFAVYWVFLADMSFNPWIILISLGGTMGAFYAVLIAPTYLGLLKQTLLVARRYAVGRQ